MNNSVLFVARTLVVLLLAVGPIRADDIGFPHYWVGHWRGEASLDQGVGDPQRFTMELIVAPTSSPERFGWTIVYDGAAGRQERAYTLLVRDAARGEYEIDENNGIILKARMIGGTLHSHFLVQGSRITTRQRLEDPGTDQEHISVEMVTTRDADGAATGNQGGVPEVTTWAARSVQSAVLRRVDARPAEPVVMPAWRKLVTEPYPGKQDDVFFISPRTGWYVNGAGKIFKTTDGGETWQLKVHKPGTFFRCIAFVDENVGIAGNIGPGYFPNVTDTVPLYRTEDGGETWAQVTAIDGPPVTGLCALEVLTENFINAGTREQRTRIYGVGRVGGPAAMVYSDDLGKSWSQVDIRQHAGMALDVHFFDRDHGVIAAATESNLDISHALILTTADGGATWKRAYQSDRPLELTWKISFPTRAVGYVTVQSYNPARGASQRYLAKTTDGGATWAEIPLINDQKAVPLGIAFVDENIGWVGVKGGTGLQTTDGGGTWAPAGFGNAVNKIRVLRTPEAIHLHAIGIDLHAATMPTLKP